VEVEPEGDLLARFEMAILLGRVGRHSIHAMWIIDHVNDEIFRVHGEVPQSIAERRLGDAQEASRTIGEPGADLSAHSPARRIGRRSTRRLGRGYAAVMPSITGSYEPPFDPRDRPPTWWVPLAALNNRPTTMLVICQACQHKRRWPVGELVERYGGRRMVQDLWIRWRCSRCGSADCLPCAIDG
jgi:hypothetical protein